MVEEDAAESGCEGDEGVIDAAESGCKGDEGVIDVDESGCEWNEESAGAAGASAGACGRKKTQKAKRRMTEMMMAERMMRRERVVCRIFRKMSSVVWKRLAGSWAVHRLITLL